MRLLKDLASTNTRRVEAFMITEKEALISNVGHIEIHFFKIFNCQDKCSNNIGMKGKSWQVGVNYKPLFISKHYLALQQ